MRSFVIQTTELVRGYPNFRSTNNPNFNQRRKHMKAELQNLSKKVSNKVKLASAYVTMATAAVLASPMAAYAADSDPKNIVTKILDVVVKIFPFVGAFFIIAGVFKLIMAYRNDQPEAQAGAARDIVIGAVFVVFRVFVWNFISASVLQ